MPGTSCIDAYLAYTPFHNLYVSFGLLIFAVLILVLWAVSITFLCTRSQLCGSALCGRVADWFCGLLGRVAEPEELIHQKAKKLYEQNRRSRYATAWKLSSILGLPLVSLGWLLCGLRSFKEPTQFVQTVQGTMLIELTLISIGGALLTIMGNRATLNMSDALSMVIFVLLSVHPVLAPSAVGFIYTSRPAQNYQLILCVFLADTGRAGPVVLLNLVLEVAMLATQPQLQIEDRTGTINFSNFLSVCTTSAFCILVASISETWLWAEAKARVVQTQASISEATTHSLLSVMCDAVVHLCPDLRLWQSCPRLDAMLLRAPTSHSTSRAFQAYFNDEDAARVVEFLSASDTAGQAKSLHVHLLDSMGNAVAAQLFHTCFPENESGWKHLVGVMEDKDSDFFPRADRQLALGHGLPAVQAPHDVRDREPTKTSADRDDASIPSIASSASSRSPRRTPQKLLGCGTNDGDCLEVLCTLTSQPQVCIQVIEKSATGEALLPFPRSMNLEEFLQCFRERNMLRKWIKWLHSGRVFNQTFEPFGKVTIIGVGADYEADLSATFHGLTEEDEDEEDESQCIQVELHLLPATADSKSPRRMRKIGRGRSRSKNRSSSPTAHSRPKDTVGL